MAEIQYPGSCVPDNQNSNNSVETSDADYQTMPEQPYGSEGLLEKNDNDNDDASLNGSDDDDGEKVAFEDDSSSEDEEVVVTIGDIKPSVQSTTTARRFQVSKLDMNITPNVHGENIFDLNTTELEERPWLKSGANIADYFNFGFTEETWNLYAEKQRLLRLEYPTQAEVNQTIINELRFRHGNKEVNVPIVLPVHNSGGRNLVTVQNIDASKVAPVKIGFGNPPAQDNLPPVVRQALENAIQKSTSLSGSSTSGSGTHIVQTVNLSNPSTASPVTSTVSVVDLTKPPPKFNVPPPMFTGNPPPGRDSPLLDNQKSDLPAGPPPSTFNVNVPPPFMRMPPVNLSRPPPTNLGGFRPSGPGFFSGPPNMNMMTGYGGPPPMNLSGPPLFGGVGQQPPQPRLTEPLSSKQPRVSSDAPPGTGEDEYYSASRPERRDIRENRRRDSDASDDDRRRRRRDRDDRERPNRDSRDSRSSRRRDDDERFESSRYRDRDSERKHRSRDHDDRDYKRRRTDDDRDRRHRRDRDRGDSSSRSVGVDLGDGPPGV